MEEASAAESQNGRTLELQLWEQATISLNTHQKLSELKFRKHDLFTSAGERDAGIY